MILQGDCREVLAGMAAGSIDACVTDPPYELGFMGKKWDATGVAFDPDTWAEVWRVLKPGGHLLAFGGTRTHHRMVCAIEDAGFEIRDEIQWLYGSGFPKSLDVSKAIDKAAGVEREVIGFDATRARPNRTGRVMGEVEYDRSDNGATVTAPATDAARQWEGWGTALKPGHEPVCVARKPLIGTVAANVQEHGTGALNIDGCRIGESGARNNGRRDQAAYDASMQKFGDFGATSRVDYGKGRWPANVILDEEAAEQLDLMTGDLGKSSGGRTVNISKTSSIYGGGKGLGQDLDADSVRGDPGFGDSGGASRFFYCAKPSKAERGEGNTHPTVKPIALLRYLVRLVTPPGGIVLDPFAGSGTTLIACRDEGFRCTGIELNPEYIKIAERRLA